ncbi:5-deoxy-glucuronate isomerase [Williamsia sp. CHRR-6]|uniref:5-deoxy-glucuronate isomerase n=1 Tax=Williamsia sp. CHRR-6 TaxID=2835871 RepID=UPI001BDAFD79|nr:5-deoxy-glucuronate isomerase [Williamsia sp. CHRR-6]MBT0565688.1 5-deoxy-glucuronate isomerase [Williamsia sp. CHRR-6]
MTGDLHIRAGSAPAPFSIAVTPQTAGWTESSMHILHLPPAGVHTHHSGDEEIIVVPLAGSVTVASAGSEFTLAGRASVFTGPSDFAYVGIDSEFTLTSAEGGRFALLGARATRSHPLRHIPAHAVPVEIRGAGQCTRQVHNFGTPEALEADSIIACEVITPGGNWSSYPAHKHDEDTDVESRLEEIYYFEIADGPTGPGVGYQRVYGTTERPIEVFAEVRTGDVVLIPHGYHGPTMSAPGYPLYFLNVMAGPGPQRAWKICDDPAHTWLREAWADQPIDPRVPIRPGSPPLSGPHR